MGADAAGVPLPPLDRKLTVDAIEYRHVRVEFDRDRRLANITIAGPSHDEVPGTLAGIRAAGANFWPLAMARELDNAILHLRFNEPELGILVFRSQGDPGQLEECESRLGIHWNDWFVSEVVLLLKRVLKRIDLTARSIFTLVEPGSCFVGTLAELVFVADRAYMFSGTRGSDNHLAPGLTVLCPQNDRAYPMGNGLSRFATRFLGEPDAGKHFEAIFGDPVDAERAVELGLVTAAYDEVDWDEEVRLALEERASFSPDALTGLEANLRFAGPETMETKIFGRLSAWQNWIFQRPGAASEEGALKRYGSGRRPNFDPKRV